MDLNQLIIDLEEIKSAINEDPERAEDLLGFVIGEIGIAAQQSVQPTAAGGSDSGENSESGGG